MHCQSREQPTTFGKLNLTPHVDSDLSLTFQELHPPELIITMSPFDGIKGFTQYSWNLMWRWSIHSSAFLAQSWEVNARNIEAIVPNGDLWIWDKKQPFALVW